MGLKRLIISITVLLLLLMPIPEVIAEEPFYKGRTITLIVATKAGGGYDFYGRLIAKFMQKHLPGSTIRVKNVPGAGHIIGTNEIYNAKPDGLTFGTFNRAIPFTQVAGLEGVNFDLARMSWLGSATPEIYSFVVSNKIKSLDDLRKADKVIIASGGAGNLTEVAAALFIQIASLNNTKTVGGYYGSEPELAMMRGEVDGQFVSFNSILQFIKSGHGHPIMFISKKQPQGYEHIPLITDVVKEEKYQSVVNLLLAVNLLGRLFAGPPEIPEDRLILLRKAFKKACEDPELLEIAAKAKRPIGYISGDEARGLVSQIMKLPAETIELLKQSYGLK